MHVAASAVLCSIGPYFPAKHADPSQLVLGLSLFAVYFPDGQSKHASWSEFGWYLPLKQFEHVACPAVEYFPPGHPRQVPPTWYFPASQSTQLVNGDTETLPAGQLRQSATLSCAVATFGVGLTRYLPASQNVHVVEPAVAWYLPASQIMHAVAAVGEELVIRLLLCVPLDWRLPE